MGFVWSLGEKGGEQLGDGASAARVEGVGGDFVERDEDEGTFGEARVGNLQMCFVQYQVAEEEEVEIEGAGAVRDARGAVPPEVYLDGEQALEQRARCEACFERDDGVEEAGLRGEADGLGGVERGADDDAAEGGEALGCGGERGLGRASVAGQVCAQADVGGVHCFQGIAGGNVGSTELRAIGNRIHPQCFPKLDGQNISATVYGSNCAMCFLLTGKPYSADLGEII